jgi:uncharacterized membrane protein (DUF373 family)
MMRRLQGEIDVAKILVVFERVIVSVLIVLMILVVLLATIDLAWVILQRLLRPPVLVLVADDLLDIFGTFLLVLIGLELLDTIRAYLSEHVVHAEVVFMAAMIAVARKVITLDVKELSPMALVGIATIILALSAGYYLFKQSRRSV